MARLSPARILVIVLSLISGASRFANLPSSLRANMPIQPTTAFVQEMGYSPDDPIVKAFNPYEALETLSNQSQSPDIWYPPLKQWYADFLQSQFPDDASRRNVTISYLNALNYYQTNAIEDFNAILEAAALLVNPHYLGYGKSDLSVLFPLTSYTSADVPPLPPYQLWGDIVRCLSDSSMSFSDLLEHLSAIYPEIDRDQLVLDMQTTLQFMLDANIILCSDSGIYYLTSYAGT